MKKMFLGLFKNVINKMFGNDIFNIYVLKGFDIG